MADTLFASDNALDIPVLDASLQAVGMDPPLVPWGTHRRGKPMRGTWHFYVDDYRFARIEQRPQLLVDSGCIGAIEPNFSIFGQTPLAVAISAVYRKRWLARWWQSHGVRVWVDLNVSYEHAELNLAGVPDGWRAFATRGYESRPEAVSVEHALVASRFPGAFMLVYGGGPKVRAVAQRIGALHVTDDPSEVRDRARRQLAGRA